MSKAIVLEYQGEKLFFNSLSQSAKDELLNINDSPFKEIAHNAITVGFFLEKGYLPFKDEYTGNRMLKIGENSKGKYIRISDNVVYLSTISAVCDFCKNQEENGIVKRRKARNQSVAVFTMDFLGTKEGKEVKYVGKTIETPLGILNAKKLEENGVVELKTIPVYDGIFDRNEDGYGYNHHNTEITFEGNKVQIGCQKFITSSLTKLAKPLREYLGK